MPNRISPKTRASLLLLAGPVAVLIWLAALAWTCPAGFAPPAGGSGIESVD
jgi:hypothetical protein